jgi:molybdate transport system ATP-binding protein
MSTLSAHIRADVGVLHLEVELDIGEGTLVLIGPNGAGKTSLLELVLGVRRPSSGRVVVGGRCLFDDSSGVDVPVEQRRLGYVPQDYALFPHMTVRDNIAFAVSGERTTAREVAQRVLLEQGLEDLAHRRPTTLSGGEKQRVALSRALAMKPSALLMDEPLAALDVHHRRAMREHLLSVLRAHPLPTLLVTHDPEDARVLGDRIAVLEAGRLTQVGTVGELTARPKTSFVGEFFGAWSAGG